MHMPKPKKIVTREEQRENFAAQYHHDVANRKLIENLTPPITHGNASMKGVYVEPVTHMRAGSDHKHPSKGF